MISLELSMVQKNQAESARLAAAMDEFIRTGGQVSHVATPPPAPRPYGYRTAPAPIASPDRKPLAPRRSKKETMQRLRIAPDIEEAQAPKAPPTALDRVRELAKTMSQGEVAEATGIHRKQLYNMAHGYGFEFQPSANGGAATLPNNQKDLARDARNVERIKAFKEVGVNRAQTARRMGISTCYLRRLILDYGIDFPVTK